MVLRTSTTGGTRVGLAEVAILNCVLGMQLTYAAVVTVDTTVSVTVDVLVIRLDGRMLLNKRPKGVSLMLFLGRISSAYVDGASKREVMSNKVCFEISG